MEFGSVRQHWPWAVKNMAITWYEMSRILEGTKNVIANVKHGTGAPTLETPGTAGHRRYCAWGATKALPTARLATTIRRLRRPLSRSREKQRGGCQDGCGVSVVVLWLRSRDHALKRSPTEEGSAALGPVAETPSTPPMQAKKRYLLLLLAAGVSVALVLLCRHQRGGVNSDGGRARSYDRSSLGPYADPAVLDSEDLCASRRRLRAERRAGPDPRRCRMHSCFDFSRCRGKDFKVYVYPPSDSVPPPSPVYQRVLRSIRESRFATADPTEACVFVPAVDTLDRDPLSPDYVKGVNLAESPLWNGGRNHLIFNLFSGTWPDYSEDLGLDVGLAMLAKSSLPEVAFRPGFDVALPLFPRSHPERGGKPAVQGSGPRDKAYLLVFKGKRYVYGIGSDTRNALHHLNNGRDVLLLTTCRHGKQWMERRDERCDADNKLYDRYEYGSLMENATFCLVPRGRRLGSFRFLEALQAGCVPVLLANGWELPLAEVVHWGRAALRGDERLLLQVPDTLRSLPRSRVHQLRQQSQLLWETYFSSVDKIVLAVLQWNARIWQRAEGGYWNVEEDFFGDAPGHGHTGIHCHPLNAKTDNEGRRRLGVKTACARRNVSRLYGP
ncbi:exostosin-1b [Ixodes scapularis]